MSDSDLTSLETEEIRSALRETVENYLNTKKYKITVSSASQAGENNFVGIVSRVSFCKLDDDPKKPKQSKLILKFAPQNQHRREQFRSRSLFLREIFMYEKVMYSVQIGKCNQKRNETKNQIRKKTAINCDSFDRFCRISVNSNNRKV